MKLNSSIRGSYCKFVVGYVVCDATIHDKCKGACTNYNAVLLTDITEYTVPFDMIVGTYKNDPIVLCNPSYQ